MCVSGILIYKSEKLTCTCGNLSYGPFVNTDIRSTETGIHILMYRLIIFIIFVL